MVLTKISIILFLCVSFFCTPFELYASEEVAIFAGGCFWCMEHDIEGLPGVNNVLSGYSGGDFINPSYQDHKGHQESVSVLFDPEVITYDSLLIAYWRNIDPLDGRGQFCDKGDSYRPVIFTSDETQNDLAEVSFDKVAQELNIPKGSIKVQIKKSSKFWPAEDYHQNYAELNKLKYNFYRYSCGRDKRLNEIWGEKARTLDKWGG